MFALVDANNFFCSAEISMRPSLSGRPVIVLSNNDGAIISRSNEAKALGIGMGVPWFTVRHLEESHGLVSLSANFALYGDLSDRIMSLTAALGTRQLCYSVDEAFCQMTGIRGDLVERSHKIRSRVLQWVGIPCGIGLGRTMTLAKLANHVAKSAERKPGSYPSHMAQVCDLATLSPTDLDAVMEATEVSDVWGVGRRITKQLNEAGITTVLQLARLDPAMVRGRWSVLLERTVRELQGTVCIGFEDAPPPKQEIACTRSFGHPVTDLVHLNEAITEFASRAAIRLRKQGSLVSQVIVFIRTSPFRQDPQYSRSISISLRRPTADTAVIVTAAVNGLRSIYKPNFQFAKAGVMLLDLQPATVQQGELDFQECEAPDRSRLMTTLDELNHRYGLGTVKLASAGLLGDARTWTMKQERRTPEYTTRWEDMPVARA